MTSSCSRLLETFVKRLVVRGDTSLFGGAGLVKTGTRCFYSTSAGKGSSLLSFQGEGIEDTQAFVDSVYGTDADPGLEYAKKRLKSVLDRPLAEPSAGEGEGLSPSERQATEELFRLHNSSMKVSGGHMIKAKVIKMKKKKAILDTGVGKLANIGVHELTEDSVLERGEEWKNSSSSGSAVCVGDTVQVFLESVETPEGDMLVTGQESAVQRRTKAVWAELLERLKDGKPVKGRLLNSLAGGYSVGVAGIVCFLPNRNASKITVSKIGELADYRVIQMNASRSNVVLEDCRLQKRRSQGGGKSSSRRPSPRQGELLRY